MRLSLVAATLFVLLTGHGHTASFSLTLEQSDNLNGWNTVPISSAMLSDQGRIVVDKASGTRSKFFRLRIAEVAEQWLLLGSMEDGAMWGRLLSSYGGSIYSLAENGGNFLKYEPATKTFSNLPKPPYATWGSASLWLNGKYYLIGGYQSSKTVAYDPNTNTWTVLADSPRQGFFQAIALNGKIYLIGGTPGGLVSYYSECSVLDPSSGWSTLPPLPNARHGAAVVDDGSDIYVIGGAANSFDLPTNTVYKFSTQSSSWSTLPPMQTSRSYAEAVHDNGNIYIIGGYPQSGQSSQVAFKPSPLERYQISASSWSSLPSLDYSDAYYYSGVIKQGGSLYAPNHGRKFDVAQNQWAAFLSRPEESSGVPILLNGKLYLASRSTSNFTVHEYQP